MGFRLEHLHRVFGAENAVGFEAWAYATRDRLGEVLGKGYFERCQSRLKPGDLIFCASEQPEPRAAPTAARERQRCLLLVTGVAWEGVETRLAQDWGRLDVPPALAPAPPPDLAIRTDRTAEPLTAQGKPVPMVAAAAVETATATRRSRTRARPTFSELAIVPGQIPRRRQRGSAGLWA